MNREFESIADFVAEYVTDVSEEGVFIRSRDPLPPGTLVTLRFTLLLDDIETVEGVGEVVRVVQEEGLEGMGVVFRELSPESHAVMERLLGASGLVEATFRMSAEDIEEVIDEQAVPATVGGDRYADRPRRTRSSAS